MTDPSSGLSLDEDGDDFILSVMGKDGDLTKVRLTEVQVMTLGQSAPAFRDRIAARHNPRSDLVSAVVATPVTHLGVQPDSLKAAVLLTLQSDTGGRLTFELLPHAVHLLLEHLPGSLAEIEGTNLRKQ